jgi:hypothetical protein
MNNEYYYLLPQESSRHEQANIEFDRTIYIITFRQASALD